jgi:hypothetical protein
MGLLVGCVGQEQGGCWWLMGSVTMVIEGTL